MQERIEGRGWLETIAPPEVWHVSYRFDIATNVVRKSGYSAIAGRNDNTGQFFHSDCEPRGDFRLEKPESVTADALLAAQRSAPSSGCRKSLSRPSGVAGGSAASQGFQMPNAR